MTDDLDAVARALANLMLRAAPGMTVRPAEGPGVQLLAGWDHPRKPGEPMWFGGVRRMKRYVSFHLMPVYSHPALLDRVSPALKARMQGKSCFNFTAEDPELFAQLEALTRDAAAAYARPFKL